MIYLLSQTIEQSAGRYPEKDAFVCGSKKLTYQQVLEQTNQLSGLLIDLGVQKGDRVGIFLNRCIETAVAIYGILRAGAVIVPLDPGAPANRTQFLINDCNISHLITNPTQSRALRKVIGKEVNLKTVIGLQKDWDVKTISWDDVFARPAKQWPNVRILEKDLAYIIYTSGSTGVPKGIMHTHQSGLAYAKLSATLYDLRPEDRVGNHAPLHFDISTFGYYSAPLAGATTVIVSDAHTKMPVSLADLMEHEKLTVWYSVPLALIQLLQQGKLADRDFSSLRWVLFGGESFPTHHLHALMTLWTDCQFSNVYGPAEVNQCTYHHMSEPPDPNTPIPIGYIWNNTEGLVVNEQDEEVATGEIGTLLIRSMTMMQGYWGQPQLTARSLYKRVTVPGYEEVFYRTGDLVKTDSDGLLHFMGRGDRQIKIRGFRVELEEITNILLTHPAVEEAAVFTRKLQDETLTLEVAIIPKVDSQLTEEVLRQYMEQQLPRYALPTRTTLTDTLPRSSNGKIDLKQLQEFGLIQKTDARSID